MNIQRKILLFSSSPRLRLAMLFVSVHFCLPLDCTQIVSYNASFQLAKLFAMWLNTSKSGNASDITAEEVLSLGKVACAATGSNIEKIPASVYK